MFRPGHPLGSDPIARLERLLAALIVLVVPASAAMQVAGATTTKSVGPLPQDFLEVPGVRELTSRLIARPLQRERLADMGASPVQAEERRAAARRALSRYRILRHVPQTDDYVIWLPPATTELEAAEFLMATENFEYVEPDWLLSPVGALAEPQQIVALKKDKVRIEGRCPDDPLFPSQWHHQDDRMQSCKGWSVVTGGPSVSIGICDTGIRTTHEDLLLHRLEAYNAVDQLWESEGGAIGPVYFHGTRTTGAAAANGNNGVGVAGVGWNLSHRMLRVSNMSNGNAFLSDLQHGARTSIESGDRVANVSYHGATMASNLPTATYIKSIGGLLLWSAGNNAANLSSSNRDDDDLIVVGASDQNDSRWSSSAYGTFVDLFAPGVGIWTTDSGSDSDYASPNGTSYACPLTSGVCAMIWSARPNLSPNDVENILKQGADDIGVPGVDDVYGYGRINLNRSLHLSGSGVPVADFAGQPPTGVSPLVVSFTDLSTGVPTQWSWSFGDGATSTLQNPAHTYTTGGVYTVSLTVSNASGSDTVTQVDYVIVDFIPPVAAFSGAPTAGLSPLAVSFTDDSSGGVPTSWFWDFGDGATSTLQNPAHTYTTSGFHTVSLTVDNPYGSDTLSKTSYITVDFIPPVASFSAQPTSGASPLVVSFTDESTAGVATSWAWSFGGGATSTLQDPVHTYTLAGSYTVSLTASNAYGSDTLVRSGYIDVLPGPAILANFVGTPTSGSAPLTVDFTDLSIGYPISWEWDFGDIANSTAQNPTYVFTEPGLYNVALTVFNALGDDDTLELEEYILVE